MGCCSSKEADSATKPHHSTVAEWEATRKSIIEKYQPIFDTKLGPNDENTNKSPETLWGWASKLSEKAEYATIFDKDATKYNEYTSRNWNVAGRNFPTVIIRIGSDDDAVVGLQLAKAVDNKEVQVCVASGAHAVRTFRSGAVAIDNVLRKSVRIIDDSSSSDDESTKAIFAKYKSVVEETGGIKLVEFEAGARIQELQDVLQKSGVNVGYGTNTGTGVCGLCLAGGLGWGQNRWGFTADNLIYADVATADDKIIRVDAESEHADLLWLMKGSGFCSGVVLRMGLRCYEFKNENVIRDQIVELALAGNVKAKKKAFIQKWEKATENLSANSFANLTLPVAAPVVVSTSIHYVQAPAEVDRNLAIQEHKEVHDALASCCCQPKETFKENFFDDLQHCLEPKQQSGFYYQSFFALKDLSSDMIDVFLKYTIDDVPAHDTEVAFVFFPARHKAKTMDTKNQKTSFAQRDGYTYLVLMLGRWNDAKHGKAGREALRLWYKRFQKEAIEKVPGSFSETAHQFSTTTTTTTSSSEPTIAAILPGDSKNEDTEKIVGGSYFLNAPPAIVDRLRKTVERYDPNNLFVRNRSLSHENAVAEDVEQEAPKKE